MINLESIVSNYAGVRRPWIGDTTDPLYKQYKFNTGIDIFGTDVYAYASGVVIAVGKDEDNYYAVTVQYDATRCIRYCHLDTVTVSEGEAIQSSFHVGTAHKYLHFEYITYENSMWPVRIGAQTYYKHDPSSIQTA